MTTWPRNWAVAWPAPLKPSSCAGFERIVGQPILLIHFGVNGLLPGAARVAFPAYHDSDSRLGLSPCQRSSFRATMPDCVYPLSPKSPKSPGVRLKRAGAPVHTPAEDLANLARYCERISSRRFRARVEIDREGEAGARHRGAY